MDNRSDIWHRLQDHEMSPPPEVLDGLRMKLKLPAEGDGASFSRLQDHMLTPPVALWPVIKAATGRAKRSRVRMLLPYVAAACLLLILVGVVVDRTSFYGHRDAVARGRPAGEAASKTGAPSMPDTARKGSGLSVSGSANATDSDASVASTVQGLPLTFSIDGRRFSLVDNSPLMTLISFKYPSLKKLIGGMHNAGFGIQLDQYTHIALSPAMAVMIKDLYDTRSNGQPSRKARRTKERFEKWKADDEKQFDGNRFSNPLDPMDLAAFIFPPLFSFGHWAGQIPAQASGAAVPSGYAASDDRLTVSYVLTVLTKKGNSGIGEAYNGGLETIFLQGGKERLRLASLMRIQSIFYGADSQRVSMLTESGTKRNKRILTFQRWSSEYNQKYTGATYSLAGDTTQILGYACKKADISLRDGRHITAWYTSLIKKPSLVLEPAFSGVPGLVLRYEYTSRKKTIRYTATSISHKPIDPSVFDFDWRP